MITRLAYTPRATRSRLNRLKSGLVVSSLSVRACSIFQAQQKSDRRRLNEIAESIYSIAAHPMCRPHVSRVAGFGGPEYDRCRPRQSRQAAQRFSQTDSRFDGRLERRAVEVQICARKMV